MTSKFTHPRGLLSATILGISCFSVQAKLSTAKIFSNHMVLQRDLAAPVWGWDTPGAEVTVTFGKQVKKAKADMKGRWQVKLDPQPANVKGQEMTVSSAGGNLKFTDILMGDVWICSGQSNMEWSVKACHNGKEEIKNANHPQIRLFDVVGHTTAPTELEKLINGSKWNITSPSTIEKFSAVGYYFGRKLQQESGVPIGLLGTNWGGTRVEPWTPPIGFRKQPELKNMSAQIDAQLPNTPTGKVVWANYVQDIRQWADKIEEGVKTGSVMPPQPKMPGPIGAGHPCAIYNAMVAPLVGYGVRGAIWYQGESNGNEGMAYLPKLKALVQGWRTVWNQPKDFPMYFYVVKLAQFHRPNNNPQGADGFARIRVAQDRIQDLPHTGVASAIDIGHPTDIHPRNKQDVGARLARWALRDVYGKKDIVVTGPTYKSITVAGNVATITYDHTGSGLMVAKRKTAFDPVAATPEQKLASFAIAGADKKWHWAEAKIVGNTVQVSSPKVAKPVAVRYAYRGNPVNANLYNKERLPAIPFRTDDWKL